MLDKRQHKPHEFAQNPAGPSSNSQSATTAPQFSRFQPKPTPPLQTPNKSSLRIDELHTTNYGSRTPEAPDPPPPPQTKGNSRFDWGSEVTVYIGQRLEGADEVPVLAHPELVCLHGDRAAATASSSFWRDLARGKKNATVPTNSSYRRSPTARWSRLICGGGGRRRGGVNRGVRAGRLRLRLRLSGRIGFLRRSRRCNILLLGAMRALLRLPVAAAWARGGFGCSPGRWGPPRQQLEISCLDHSKKNRPDRRCTGKKPKARFNKKTALSIEQVKKNEPGRFHGNQ